METIYIAICDDSNTEQNHLLSCINQSSTPTRCSFFSSGEEFLSSYHPGDYDLILMDIYMKELTGIDTITKIREIDQQVSVAFTTTSLDHSLESYRLSALKYIEKPVNFAAIEELLLLVQLKKKNQPSLQIKVNRNLETIYLNDIIFLEQKAWQSLIHLRGGKTITTNGKISELWSKLNSSSFLSCHKSYIVNLNYVANLDTELYLFTMTEGENVYIRRESLREVKKAYENYIFDKTRRG